MKPIDLQPSLSNEWVSIRPLKEDDFDALFSVASDPLLWEQHPNRDRYKPEVFKNFFKGALESGSAFLVFDQKTGNVIGSSRFYDYVASAGEIAIGYTFIGRDHWGGIYNPALKKLMIDHAFTFCKVVHFHIGAKNIRSQKAIAKLGARKIAEKDIAYYGETPNMNFIYELTGQDWKIHSQPGQGSISGC